MPRASAPPPIVRIGDERIDEEEIRELLRQDRKIEAIKRVRDRTGLGLAEAKDAVEAVEHKMR
ncbi:ribosomal protein L7/L12 [Sphingopyxis fribergensis]|nr:ribosomal protein L7/L12 [Sphingopyxis fribergensis]